MPRDPRLWDLTPGASLLNEHREEVIRLFRGGLALKKIGAKFGTVEANVQKWLKREGEYNKTMVCALPECNKTFPFRPRQLYCCKLHARRADARNRYERDKPKLYARRAVNSALAKGSLVRPGCCERCGCNPGFGKNGRKLIHADHHYGYDEEHWLDIWWICSRCDSEIERLRRGGVTVNREHPHQDHTH